MPLDDTALIHAYVSQHRRVDNIARSHGVASSEITRRLGQLGVLRLGGPTRAVAIDPDELHDLYTVQGMTVPAIAAHFGVSPPTIRKRITTTGLRPASPPADATLRSLYLDQHLSVPAIADRHSLGPRTVAKRILAHGPVPSRPVTNDGELALDLYYLHGITPAGIARALGAKRVDIEAVIARAGRRHVKVNIVIRSRDRDAATIGRIERRVGADQLPAHLGLSAAAIAQLRP